jgi:hypothetical protein
MLRVGSPRPEDKVKTFLREPFFKSGRNALVVSTGPITLVNQLALKFSSIESSSGNCVISWKVCFGSWYAPLLIRTSREPPVILETSSAAA